MKTPSSIKPGMFVICLDDENIESIVNKTQSYFVCDISHRGALVKLQGVGPSLAAVRFVPLTSAPSNPVEFANASNS